MLRQIQVAQKPKQHIWTNNWPWKARALTFQMVSKVARCISLAMTSSSLISRLPQVMHTSDLTETYSSSKHFRKAGSNLAVIRPEIPNKGPSYYINLLHQQIKIFNCKTLSLSSGNLIPVLIQGIVGQQRKTDAHIWALPVIFCAQDTVDLYPLLPLEPLGYGKPLP